MPRFRGADRYLVQAAERGDRHLAFMSLESLNEMMNDISSEADIGMYDVISAYDPGDLRKTADGFERILRLNLQEYEKAWLHPARYADVDAFISAYLESDRQQDLFEQRIEPQEAGDEQEVTESTGIRKF